jgi:hypothetical protein
MTCECGHESDVHEGRCFAPGCTCEAFREVSLTLGLGSGDNEAEAIEERVAFAGAVLSGRPKEEPRDLLDLFAPEEAQQPRPVAVVFASRSGGPWPHVVAVSDHPNRPYLMCSCRSFAVRGTCWAAERASEMLGVPVRERG